MGRWTGTGAAALAALLGACGGAGDQVATPGGGGGAGGPAGGGTPCGTQEAPAVLELAELSPGMGETVAGQPVVHGFRVVRAPGAFADMNLLFPQAHTAGNLVESELGLGFTFRQDGEDIVYEGAPVSWERAPGHVEMRVATTFTTAEGCWYVFPAPLFSYEVE